MGPSSHPEPNKNINLIERPEYKRRWNTEPWAKRQQSALRKWLLARLEGYFFEGERVCDIGKGVMECASRGVMEYGSDGVVEDPNTPALQHSNTPAASAAFFTAATRPHLVTANQLADAVQSDHKFLEAAEVYEGAGGFSVPKLIRTLVESEAVPFLPVHRYKDSGLRKREDWEATWELQRKEDAVEEGIRSRGARGQ